MNKIKSFFKGVRGHGSIPTLSTPVAIIIGSIIIALGIVGYGYVSRPIGEVTQDLVKEIAKELKLKGSKWESCLASEEVVKQVERELNDGIAAGVTGTPTTFILAKKGGSYETVATIVGAPDDSTAQLQSAIELALSGKAKSTAFGGSQVSDTEFVNGVRSEVLVIEYADAECPFCMKFHPSMIAMMDTYKDRVGFVYRHYPLPPRIHPNALPYAVAIECAGNLKGKDAYFSFIDKLLTQGQ